MAIYSELNGIRIRDGRTGGIYVVDRGHKRLIPDMATYEYLFLRHNGALDNFDVTKIDDGPGLPRDSVLARIGQSAGIWLIESGSKRWIRDMATFVRWDLNYLNLVGLPPGVMAAIPDGDVIETPANAAPVPPGLPPRPNGPPVPYPWIPPDGPQPVDP